MKKKPQKPHYIKQPLEPEWEDETPSEIPVDPKIKQEEEARLFREAVEKGLFAAKESKEEEEQRLSNSARSKRSPSRHEIDLHGMTVSNAQSYVIDAINNILSQAKGQPVDIRIITGKGHHSKGRQPQLISEIHHIVESTFRHRLITIEASPHELNLGGMYLKGHFDLRIK